MTQKHVQVPAYAVLLSLAMSTAWAEVKKESSRELLPAPKCCCEKIGSSIFACCPETELRCKDMSLIGTGGRPAKKECDLDHWLQTACPLDIKDTPLCRALDNLRTMTGLNIVVDEPALSEAAISLERPLTLKVEGMPLGNLLSLLLHQARLVYVIRDNVLLVTTEAQARGKVINRVHPVSDLLWPADPIILPTGDGDVFFGWSSQTPAGMRLLDETPEETLITLITQSIEPATWCVNGGPGTIDYFPVGKSLVVHQTADVQEQIAELLQELRRSQEEKALARGPAPFMSILLPMPAPVASPPPCPSFTLAAPVPRLYSHPVPFATGLAPPPCPLAGLMWPPAPCPAPALQPTPASRTYVLQAKMMQQHLPDRKAINCQAQTIAFRAEPCFHGNMRIVEKGGKQCQEGWLIQVKATALKNERLHLEATCVQAKAENASNGEVALDLNVTPLLDRHLRLGKTVKKVLERDEAGTPRKWVELTVEEMQQAPVAMVCPPPAGPPTPAPVVTAMSPTPSMAAAMICQPACPAMPPAPAIVPCVTQPRYQPNKTWQVHAVVEEGKARLAIQQDGQDSAILKSMEIMIPGSDPLKLSAAGKQIWALTPSLSARADKVSRTGPAGCFVFEGHVKLTYNKEGQRAKVSAERVLVHPADGHLEIQDGHMAIQPAAAVQPHSH